MSDQFNAYHKWLGIPLKNQPPNHYRLLGIELFEADPDVIDSAADQRMAHVRSFQAGPHSALSQRILNEISAARVCLLDPKKKADYDRKLTAQLSPPTSPAAPAKPRPAAPPPASRQPSRPAPAKDADDSPLELVPLDFERPKTSPSAREPSRPVPPEDTDDPLLDLAPLDFERPKASPSARKPSRPAPVEDSDDSLLDFAPLESDRPKAAAPARGQQKSQTGDRITNEQLTEAHLPPPDASWDSIASFASSYSGYDHWKTHAECVDVANSAAEFYLKLEEVPGTLDELRTCLFVDFQRYLEYGWTPDELRLKYLRALVEGIRKRLRRGR